MSSTVGLFTGQQARVHGEAICHGRLRLRAPQRRPGEQAASHLIDVGVTGTLGLLLGMHLAVYSGHSEVVAYES